MVKILLMLVTPAAFVWRYRAKAVELAGAGCLVIAGALWSPVAGFLVAGMCLLAKSFVMAGRS